MAVTQCKLLAEGDLATTFTRDRVREYDLTYAIETNSVMGPISVQIGALLSAPDALPDIWDSYAVLGDADLNSYCSQIQLKRRRRDPKRWLANVHFSTLAQGQDPGLSNVNPLLRPVKYRGAKMVSTRPINRDKDGRLIVNSAKEEFDEPLEGELVLPLLVATRNVASLDVWLNDMGTFLHSVNTSNYRNQSARKWACMDLEISDVIYEEGVAFYQETWSLGFNPGLWDEVLLDRGWKVLNDESPAKKVNATDDKGKPVSEPVLLNGAGKKLPTGADPVGVTFRCKREVAWTNIPV